VNDPQDTTAEEPANPLPDVTIEELSEPLRAAVARAGWLALMPVQARAIPYLLAGRNVMIQARTGSGKTGAFLLPMVERLDPKKNRCQALILVPTRELARQVWNEAQIIFGDKGLRTVAVYGGVGYSGQTEALRGGAHVVVGTPGRVLDHLLKRNFSLEHLEMLIFDEADRMLSMGFYEDMLAVKRYLPQRDINACMFSATFPAYVLRTAWQFMEDPEFISLSRDHVHVTETEHVVYQVPDRGRERALVRLIEVENPGSAIIFCNTKVNVHFVAVVLQRFGYDADELSADLAQNDRERVLERVRQGTLRFLVATDVAARGIDIPELSHVIQYELPEDPESYVHRAGRTGRAGAAGIAITFINGIADKLALDRIAKRFSVEFEERTLPSDADLEAVVAERVTALLEARLRERDNIQQERARRFTSLARTWAESEDEVSLLTMLIDDYYQQMLHKPVAPPAPEGEGLSQPVKPKGGGRRRRRR